MFAEHPAATMLLSTIVLTILIAVIDKSRMIRDAKATTEVAMQENLGNSIRFWERRRVIYNVVIAAVFAGWAVLTWPHFREASILQALLFLVIFAAMANLLYSAVYVVDIPLQHSALKTVWHRWRLGSG